MSDMRTALLMIALAGCTPAQVRHVNRAGAALTMATMACDWGSTRQAARERMDDWEEGFPARPVMGGSPSVGRVDTYFAASTTLLLALAQLVPERYRWIGYSTVVAVESAVIENNMHTTHGMCGVDL